MSEPTNNGELLLPVCIPKTDITEIIGALDLYRVLKKGGQSYVAFDAVMAALEFIDNPQNSPCLPDIQTPTYGACYRMDTTSEIFSFYPNNPFDPSDDATTPIGMSWVRLGNIGQDLLPNWLQSAVDNLDPERIGYFENDCFMSYDVSLNPLQAITNQVENFFNALRDENLYPFPIATINFEGTGQIEIEFAQVPAGGSVLVVWDFQPEVNDVLDIIQGNPNNLDNFALLELQRDVISIPPELVSTTIFEQEFTDNQPHIIQCFFFPTIQPDQAPFFFPFGGIREVEFCGDIKVIGSETGTIYDKNNYRDNSTREGVINLTLSLEEMIKAIRIGNNRSKEDIAKRILLALDSDNLLNDVTIDKDIDTGADSTVSIVGSNTSPIVAPSDSTREQQLFGGAYRIAVGIRDLFAEEQQLRQNGFTATSIANISRLIINPADIGAWTALITGYGASGVNITIDADLLAPYIYCEPVGTAIARYSVEQMFTEAQIDYLSQFVEQIPPAKFEEWRNDGQTSPRDGYQTSACYRYPTVIYEWVGAEATRNSQQNSGFLTAELVDNRRYLVTLSGQVERDNGEKWDGLWYTDVNGNRSYVPFGILASNWSSNSTPNVQVAYNPNGYSVTVDALVADRIGAITGLLLERLDIGAISFKIADLGAI